MANDLNRHDVVALLRAAETATEGDDEALVDMIAGLDPAEALYAIGVLVVVVQAAHQAGANGETFADWLAGLDA